MFRTRPARAQDCAIIDPPDCPRGRLRRLRLTWVASSSRTFAGHDKDTRGPLHLRDATHTSFGTAHLLPGGTDYTADCAHLLPSNVSEDAPCFFSSRDAMRRRYIRRSYSPPPEYGRFFISNCKREIRWAPLNAMLIIVGKSPSAAPEALQMRPSSGHCCGVSSTLRVVAIPILWNGKKGITTLISTLKLVEILAIHLLQWSLRNCGNSI